MHTPKSNARPALAIVMSLSLIAIIGCGRSGISKPGSTSDGSITTGGNDGQNDAGNPADTGGQTGSTAMGGSSGSGESGGTGGASSPGGVKATSGGQGGATILGSSTGGTSSAGGATMIPGSSTGGTSSPGGVKASTSSNQGGATHVGGQGGTSLVGGSRASGGSSGWRPGTIVSPRVPTEHRPQASSCVGVFAPVEPVNPQYGDCKKHADCTKGTNGRCITSKVGMGSGRYYYCSYDTCATDADCDSGKVCYCSPTDPARCFSLGNCRTDADCGGGAYSTCSPAYGFDCGGYHQYSSYYCHTPADTCLEDRDCTGRDYCDFDVIDGHWSCRSPDMSCIIG